MTTVPSDPRAATPDPGSPGTPGIPGSPWLPGTPGIRRLILAALAVAILGAALAACWPAVQGGFIFDDDTHLTNNPVLGPGGLAKVWRPGPGGYIDYWPLTFTAYWVQFQVWGLNPVGYHLVNLVMHGLCALLVWRVLALLRVPGALLAGAIFALHPVNVETAAWISQLKTTLSVLLALASVVWYLHHERRGGWWRYTLAVVLFLLSGLAKPTAVTLPAVLLLLAWWQRGRIGWRDVGRVVPYVVIGGVLTVLAVTTQGTLTTGQVIRDDGMFSRAAVAGRAVWFYLGELVWPTHLTLIYPRWVVDPHDPRAYLPGAALLAVLVAAWVWRHRWGRAVLVMLGCYLALLLPVLGFVNISFMEHSLVADHWQYLAMIAPIALGAGWAARGVEALARHWHPRVCRALAWGLALMLLVLLGTLTYAQASLYPDTRKLWESVLVENPNSWLAHNNLGLVLRNRGQVEDAIYHYRRALWLDPAFALAYINLGELLAAAGRYSEAIPEYQAALQCKPEYAAAHNNLGRALDQLGRSGEAIPELRRALELSPNYTLAHVNLGDALANLGRYEEALEEYRAAEKLDASIPHMHMGMATALLALGRAPEAAGQYQEVLDRDGQDRAALYALAWLRATHAPGQGGDPQQALALAERLDREMGRPDPASLGALAGAYAAAGRFPEAVAAAQRAIALAQDAGRRDAVAVLEGQLACYRAGRPFRVAPPAPMP